MANSIQTAFRMPPEGVEKMDMLARWFLETRTSVVLRAINELYAREAARRGVEPYPEVDRSAEYPSYEEGESAEQPLE